MRDIAKAHRAGRDIGHDGREIGEHHRHAAGDDILGRRRRRPVRHKQDAAPEALHAFQKAEIEK